MQINGPDCKPLSDPCFWFLKPLSKYISGLGRFRLSTYRIDLRFFLTLNIFPIYSLNIFLSYINIYKKRIFVSFFQDTILFFSLVVLGFGKPSTSTQFCKHLYLAAERPWLQFHLLSTVSLMKTQGDVRIWERRRLFISTSGRSEYWISVLNVNLRYITNICLPYIVVNMLYNLYFEKCHVVSIKHNTSLLPPTRLIHSYTGHRSRISQESPPYRFLHDISLTI